MSLPGRARQAYDVTVAIDAVEFSGGGYWRSSVDSAALPPCRGVVGAPARAFVVRGGELSELAGPAVRVFQRGHQARSLWMILGQHGGVIPAVLATHRSDTTLETGVQQLCKQAADHAAGEGADEGHSNVFIVGIAERFFDALWKRAAERAPDGTNARRNRSGTASTNLLVDALGHEESDADLMDATWQTEKAAAPVWLEKSRLEDRLAKAKLAQVRRGNPSASALKLAQQREAWAVDRLQSATGQAARLAPATRPRTGAQFALSSAIVGVAAEMRLVRRQVQLAAKQSHPVLVVGESGTGKEAVAKSIHALSQRPGELVTINCAAIPAELLEAELFGTHEGGGTGLLDRPGLWERAHRGTLFLDEFGDLTPPHQAKVLRAIETGIIQRIGGTETMEVDARIVAATNRDIFAMVRAGQFRDDLYYRVRSFLIRTPELRSHPEDIPALAQHFWRTRVCRDPEATLPAAVLAELAQHSWPSGNARELRQVLINLFTLFGNTELRVKHVRAVMHIEDHVMRAPARGRSAATPHWVDSLRHLLLVDEVLRACQRTAQTIAGPHDRDRTVARTALGRNVEELAELCRSPELFPVPATLEALGALARRAGAFPPRASVKDVRSLAQKLAAELDRTLERVGDQIEKLVDPG